MLHQPGHCAARLSRAETACRPRIYVVFDAVESSILDGAVPVFDVFCLVLGGRCSPSPPTPLSGCLAAVIRALRVVLTWDDRGCPEGPGLYLPGASLGSGPEALWIQPPVFNCLGPDFRDQSPAGPASAKSRLPSAAFSASVRL
jgi:hypothetical protein